MKLTPMFLSFKVGPRDGVEKIRKKLDEAVNFLQSIPTR
jgi:hypothetical protein